MGKGSKLMVLIDGLDLPMAVKLHAANYAEAHLIQPSVVAHQLAQYPPRLIYDRAADSNMLRDELATDGIPLITPHRMSCRNINPSQDYRALKRYKNRWKFERTIAWLGNHRRVTRYDRDSNHFHAFVILACAHQL